MHRQPFPGPGLAIRIIGDVDAEKLTVLKNADAIVREELDAYNERLFAETGERNSEHSVWQYFAVLQTSSPLASWATSAPTRAR